MAFTRLKLVALADAFRRRHGGSGARETVLRRGQCADPQTLDPQKLEGVPEYQVTADLFEG